MTSLKRGVVEPEEIASRAGGIVTSLFSSAGGDKTNGGTEEFLLKSRGFDSLIEIRLEIPFSFGCSEVFQAEKSDSDQLLRSVSMSWCSERRGGRMVLRRVGDCGGVSALEVSTDDFGITRDSVERTSGVTVSSERLSLIPSSPPELALAPYGLVFSSRRERFTLSESGEP